MATTSDQTKTVYYIRLLDSHLLESQRLFKPLGAKRLISLSPAHAILWFIPHLIRTQACQFRNIVQLYCRADLPRVISPQQNRFLLFLPYVLEQVPSVLTTCSNHLIFLLTIFSIDTRAHDRRSIVCILQCVLYNCGINLL